MAIIKDFFTKAGVQATQNGLIGIGSANYLQAAGAASGNPVTISALGTDPNIGVNIVTKGTGTLTVNGATLGVPGGSNGQIQYNNAGAFGGIASSGSGNVALTTSAALTTPSVAGGTLSGITAFGLRNAGTGAFDVTLAINQTLTAGRTLTVTIPDAATSLSLGGNLTTANTFATSGNFALTLTTTALTNVTLPVTGTLATLAGSETFTNKTLTTPQINAATVGVAATVTAGTNAQNQGALTSDINVVTTNASNPGGVTLPAGTTGRWVSVINKSANAINVYPATGASIDGLAANASVNLPVGAKLEFLAYATTTWVSSATGAKGNGILTLGGNLTTSGAFATTFTMTGATSVTFPTSGTLATTTSSISGSAGSVANAVTFNNGGAGAASGTSFNGSAAVTVSYNTVGAPSTTGTGASGSWGISITGTAAISSAATIADDTSTAATMYPTWVTANTGNLPVKTTSTKLTFNPSTGVLSSTSFTGAGTGLTGSAASLSIGGNAATATTATTAGSVTNSVTFNNSNTGSGSGATYNGGSAITVSANTVGALSLSGGTMTGNLTLSADPTQALHAATKQYVDAASSGLDIKASVRAGTTAALTVTYANGASGVGATLTNTGTLAAIVLDGVTLAVNDRVLVKNQASAFQNGIYTVTTVGSGAIAWVMTRATDADTAVELTPGMFTFIEEGTTLNDTGWVMSGSGTTTMGTTNLPFTQFSSAGVATAGNGIVQVGNVFHFAQSSNYTIGDLYYASSTTGLSRLAAVATGNVLLSAGLTTAPAYGKVNLDTSGTAHVTGTLQVGSGGTGVVTLSGIAFGNGTSAFTAATGAQISTALGSTNITGNAANVTGIVATANGGTGANLTLSQYGVVVASTTTAMTSTVAGTVGQALVANTGATPTFQTLTLSSLPDAWVKRACKVATTASITTLAGGAPSTLDGVALSVNDRILVKNQATASQNGIYTVTTVGTGANGTWVRSAIDGNTAAFMAEASTSVDQGTANAGKTFRTTFNATNTLDTTAMNWFEVLDGNNFNTYAPTLTGTGASGTWAISISGSANSATTATTATVASTSTIADDTSTNATVYPSWVTANTGNLPSKVTSTRLTFNPSTGVLTATGGFAGTATVASTATIVDDTTTNATMYPLWVTANTGNLPAKVSSTKISFNPSTGTLTATTFSGALSGTASTATAASTVTVVDDTTTNATMYPLWVTANTGNLAAKVSSTKVSLNPSTGTVTASAFSTTGTVTTATTAYGSTSQATTGSAAVTTTSTTNIDTWSSTSFRSARYTFQIADGTSYETADVLIIHDGTTPYVTMFGNVFTSTNSLGTVDATIAGGVTTVTYTAVTATSKTVKFTRQLITV